MIRLFENPDVPPYFGSNHLLTFSTIYPDIWQQGLDLVGLEKVGEWCKTVQKAWYKRGKNFIFSVQYGSQFREDGTGTADRAAGRPGSHAKMRDRFPRIHGPGGLNEACCRFADEHGYIETVPDRRVDPNHGYPLMTMRTEYGKVMPTIPLSYKVQGSAGYWMGNAMCKVHPQLQEWTAEDARGFWMVLTVHDQLVFDFPKGKGKEPWKTNLPKIRRLKMLMESCGEDFNPSIPTPCSVSYHPDNWGEERIIL